MSRRKIWSFLLFQALNGYLYVNCCVCILSHESAQSTFMKSWTILDLSLHKKKVHILKVALKIIKENDVATFWNS